jgi:hypothetical protein
MRAGRYAYACLEALQVVLAETGTKQLVEKVDDVA